MERTTARTKSDCPHCRKPIRPGDAVWPCQECQLVQHVACVERNEGCHGCLVEFVPLDRKAG